MNTWYYLDWNIFSTFKRIEQLDDKNKLIFKSIFEFILIQNPNHLFPYSPAHIFDLIPSYAEDNHKLDQDLDNLSLLTKKLFICQYWGQENVDVNIVPARDTFFNFLYENQNYSKESLIKLIKQTKGESFISKKIKSKIDFKGAENTFPILKMIFPDTIRTKSEWSLIKDLIGLHSNMKNNYAVYSGLKKVIIDYFRKETQSAFLNGFNMVENVENFHSIEKNKSLKELIDGFDKDATAKQYNQFLRFYFNLNLYGLDTPRFEKKQPFNNIFNDSLHSFYASHCDIYISNDQGNREKTKILYNDLNIKTLVYSPLEFFDFHLKKN